MEKFCLGAGWTLSPCSSQRQKSFWWKADVWLVYSYDDGTLVGKALFSYGTPIAISMDDGKVLRLWDGWSATTGKHIYAFCQLHKKEFQALPLTLVEFVDRPLPEGTRRFTARNAINRMALEE